MSTMVGTEKTGIKGDVGGGARFATVWDSIGFEKKPVDLQLEQ